MIRAITPSQFDAVLNVINEAAQAYKGVIPEDRWKEPYMPAEELKEEIQNGVQFHAWMENDTVVAVMGIQRVNDVTLIRHAYVAPNRQRKGIGAKLLTHLLSIAPTTTVLVGTWQAAYWAIRFYEKHGFRLVSNREKDMLLRKYWNIPERQIETSVVLKLKRKN
jgi:GNAT superfamily N-acetyltransferase